MTYTREYLSSDPTPTEVEALTGPAVIEFGNRWCGHCRRAEPLIRQAFGSHPRIRHIKIADASGKRLGRSFRVKLWPTLVFLKNGREIARLVRPSNVEAVLDAMSGVN